jgi:hypothetical protein
MSKHTKNREFETGVRVRHIDGRIGLIRRDQKDGKFLVSVRGGKDEEWSQAEISKADEPDYKWQQPFRKAG